MKKTPPRGQSGSSLIVVISVLATLLVIVGVAAEYTSTIGRHVRRSSNLQNAATVADNCIEILFANWRAICSAPGSAQTAQATSAFSSSIPLPTAAQLNLPSKTSFAKAGTSFDPNQDEYFPDYTISNFKVIAVGPEWNSLGSASVPPIPMLGQLNGPVTATTTTTPMVYNYIASADVTLPSLGPTGSVVAKVRRVFQKQQLSPWNFAIFYADTLEIHPGAQFTVTGWVHTNSDLYTGHSSLTFADKVTYASDWFVGFMPGETSHAGETPAAPNYPSNLPPARDQAKQPFGLDSTAMFSTTDSNPNNDSYRELVEQAVAGYTDPLAGQRYYDQSAIRILINSSGSKSTLTIKRPNGSSETTLTSSSTDNDKKLYTAITDALTTDQTIQDNREGATMKLTTLDVSKLVTSLTNNGPGNSRIDPSLWNGIVYIADTTASATARRGVRLINGQVLPGRYMPNDNNLTVDGLTVASPNPVYIQGDYNTGIGTIPSNSTTNNDPTTPQAPGYTRQPASVVADAVSILSNNWSDANSGTDLSKNFRNATPTTINTAIVAGIVPSAPVGGDGSYSGGAENFPRFLENWSHVTITYYGSMVELFQSKQSIGKWGSANVYNAPTRQWYFETNFKTNPPPGSIMLYSYFKGKWTLLGN